MGKRNGSTNAAPVSAEQATETQASAADASDDTSGASEAPLTAQPGEQEPQGESGPEDFARHTGARLMTDHAADVERAAALEAELGPIRERLEKRGGVIAERLIERAKAEKKRVNPIVTIAGRRYAPKVRPEKHGGGFHLVAHTEREEGSIA